MKHFFRIFIISLFLTSSAQHAYADINSFCTNKWPADENKREYCETQQILANQKLFSIGSEKGLVHNGVLSSSTIGNVYEKIIHSCMKKGEVKGFQTYDFPVVVECVEKQFQSVDDITDLGFETKSTGIKAYCANKWPDKEPMQKYCEEEQTNANLELFSIAKGKGLVKDGRISVSTAGDNEEKIILQCMKKWQKDVFNTYDFVLVVTCIKEKI